MRGRARGKGKGRRRGGEEGDRAGQRERDRERERVYGLGLESVVVGSGCAGMWIRDSFCLL